LKTTTIGERPSDVKRKTSYDDEVEEVIKQSRRSHVERFSKTLFVLSRCRIAEDDGSGDLLSQS
jgi:hypothetical protein